MSKKGDAVNRMTDKQDNGEYAIGGNMVQCSDLGCVGPGVERLAAYENMHEALEGMYRDAAEKLDALKAQGKLKTSSAQTLLAQKLSYSSMMSLIDFYLPDNENRV